MGQILRLQGGTLPFVNLFVDTSVWSLAFRRDAAGLTLSRMQPWPYVIEHGFPA